MHARNATANTEVHFPNAHVTDPKVSNTSATIETIHTNTNSFIAPNSTYYSNFEKPTVNDIPYTEARGSIFSLEATIASRILATSAPIVSTSTNFTSTNFKSITRTSHVSKRTESDITATDAPNINITMESRASTGIMIPSSMATTAEGTGGTRTN